MQDSENFLKKRRADEEKGLLRSVKSTAVSASVIIRQERQDEVSVKQAMDLNRYNDI